MCAQQKEQLSLTLVIVSRALAPSEVDLIDTVVKDYGSNNFKCGLSSNSRA